MRPDEPSVELAALEEQRIELSWFDIAQSVHTFVKVDGIEVHRMLSEGDVSRLNRQHPGAWHRYTTRDTYHGFDSEEEAVSAARAVIASDLSTLDPSWPRFLVERQQGRWVPVTAEYWLESTP